MSAVTAPTKSELLHAAFKKNKAVVELESMLESVCKDNGTWAETWDNMMVRKYGEDFAEMKAPEVTISKWGRRVIVRNSPVSFFFLFSNYKGGVCSKCGKAAKNMFPVCWAKHLGFENPTDAQYSMCMDCINPIAREKGFTFATAIELEGTHGWKKSEINKINADCRRNGKRGTTSGYQILILNLEERTYCCGSAKSSRKSNK